MNHTTGTGKSQRRCKARPEISCRFVNDVLHIEESGEDLFRRAPAEGTHGEIVVLVLPDSKLLAEVLKGIELV